MADSDEIFDEGEQEARPEAPSARVVVRDGVVTVTEWQPWLANGGPLGNMFRDRERERIAIADLTAVGESSEEVIVRFRAAGRARRDAEHALIRWAAAVGYRRVWLPDSVVDLEPPPDRRAASVECPTCGADWADADPDFWLSVREGGCFPTTCPLCGGHLPQWSVYRDRRGAGLAKGAAGPRASWSRS